ncbi:MAG: DUF3737 family protein [Enterococcus italicus]|uniref:DUF3737 family protein n=1 Tax=Enterococcus italicus TaxID=246144 RepID=UPI003993AA9B
MATEKQTTIALNSFASSFQVLALITARIVNVASSPTRTASVFPKRNNQAMYNPLISSVVTSDGAKNIIIKNSKLLSKDAFWNCEDVTVYDSTIIGEYLGWNSKNLRFVNCYIESEQGMCHIEYLVIDGAKIINTDLVFEYSTVDINVTSAISNVKNTYSGSISASEIKELILEQSQVDPTATVIKERKCATIR